ncbi:hypothetical protein TNCV_718071 [Trichonephila clavipes]|nr:hypothetical protein TNCV_718071 [Trichonephila clavipes]
MVAVDFLHQEKSTDLGRGRTHSLGYRRPATIQLRHLASIYKLVYDLIRLRKSKFVDSFNVPWPFPPNEMPRALESLTAFRRPVSNLLLT